MSPSLEIGRALKINSDVRRRCPVQTLVQKNSKLELDPLWCSQPVQLLKQQSDVVIARDGSLTSRLSLIDQLAGGVPEEGHNRHGSETVKLIYSQQTSAFIHSVASSAGTH